MPKSITDIPKFVVSFLLVAAIVNLLIGVFLRYVMIEVTDYFDLDPVRFTWVEEVGEMLLAWLTLIGAAIGVRERTHFTLHVFTQRLPLSVQTWIERGHHLLIAIVGGLAAWYGVKLCVLHSTLKTPGLELNLALLYASVVVGGVLMVIYAVSMIVSPPPRDLDTVPLEVRAE
jgi:TRAP-type C4-dicarboxylate transport system permease small subunit